jgi:hypothetical protein
MLRRGSLLAAWAMAVIGVVTWSSSVAQAQFGNRPAELYIVHGLPGDELDDPTEMIDIPNNLPVDVCVGLPGTGTLNCFYAGVEFGQIRGPLSLTAGTYQVEIREADLTTPGSGPLLVSGTVPLRSGSNFTAIVHITPAGTPKLTAYENDTARLALTSSRVTFRHDSRNPPVDMSLQSTIGQPGVATFNLANPQQSAASNVATGPYVRYVKPAGQPTDLLTPAAVFLNPRNAYFFYLVGSTERSTLQVITHNFQVKIR